MGAVHFSKDKVFRVFLAWFCFWGLLSLTCAGRLSVSRQNFEVHKHLNRLNKPAIKSIQVLNPLFLNLHFQFLFVCLFTSAEMITENPQMLALILLHSWKVPIFPGNFGSIDHSLVVIKKM